MTKKPLVRVTLSKQDKTEQRLKDELEQAKALYEGAKEELERATSVYNFMHIKYRQAFANFNRFLFDQTIPGKKRIG